MTGSPLAAWPPFPLFWAGKMMVSASLVKYCAASTQRHTQASNVRAAQEVPLSPDKLARAGV